MIYRVSHRLREASEPLRESQKPQRGSDKTLRKSKRPVWEVREGIYEATERVRSLRGSDRPQEGWSNVRKVSLFVAAAQNKINEKMGEESRGKEIKKEKALTNLCLGGSAEPSEAPEGDLSLAPFFEDPSLLPLFPRTRRR